MKRKINWNDLRKLVELDLSLRDIAFLKHCSHETVRTKAREKGIELRPTGRRKNEML